MVDGIFEKRRLCKGVGRALGDGRQDERGRLVQLSWLMGSSKRKLCKGVGYGTIRFSDLPWDGMGCKCHGHMGWSHQVR